MNDGDYHDAITRHLAPFCALVCGALAWYWGWDRVGIAISVLCGAFGCLWCLICNPDLDLTGVTNAEKNLGAFKNLWACFWWPYARLIPWHRHWSSHAPVIGTVCRLAYLAVAPALVVTLCGAWQAVVSFLWVWPYAVMWAASLAVADCGHWWRDMLESAKKHEK